MPVRSHHPSESATRREYWPFELIEVDEIESVEKIGDNAVHAFAMRLLSQNSLFLRLELFVREESLSIKVHGPGESVHSQVATLERFTKCLAYIVGAMVIFFGFNGNDTESVVDVARSFRPIPSIERPYDQRNDDDNPERIDNVRVDRRCAH